MFRKYACDQLGYKQVDFTVLKFIGDLLKNKSLSRLLTTLLSIFSSLGAATSGIASAILDIIMEIAAPQMKSKMIGKTAVYPLTLIIDILILSTRILSFDMMLFVKLDQQIRLVYPDSNLFEQLASIRFTGDFKEFERKIDRLITDEIMKGSAQDIVAMFSVLRDFFAQIGVNRYRTNKAIMQNPLFDNPGINFLAGSKKFESLVHRDSVVEGSLSESALKKKISSMERNKNPTAADRKLLGELKKKLKTARLLDVEYDPDSRKLPDSTKKLLEKVGLDVAAFKGNFPGINLSSPTFNKKIREAVKNALNEARIAKTHTRIAVEELSGGRKIVKDYYTNYFLPTYTPRNLKISLEEFTKKLFKDYSGSVNPGQAMLDNVYKIMAKSSPDWLGYGYDAIMEDIYIMTFDLFEYRFSDKGRKWPIINVGKTAEQIISGDNLNTLRALMFDDNQRKYEMAKADYDINMIRKKMNIVTQLGMFFLKDFYKIKKALIMAMPTKLRNFLYPADTTFAWKVIDECLAIAGGVLLGPGYLKQIGFKLPEDRVEFVRDAVDPGISYDPLLTDALIETKIVPGKRLKKYVKEEEKQYNIFVEAEELDKVLYEEMKKEAAAEIEREAADKTPGKASEKASAKSTDKAGGAPAIPGMTSEIIKEKIQQITQESMTDEELSAKYRKLQSKIMEDMRKSPPKSREGYTIRTEGSWERAYNLIVREGVPIKIAMEENKIPSLIAVLTGLYSGRIIGNNISLHYKRKIHSTLCFLSSKGHVIAGQIGEINSILLGILYLYSRLITYTFSVYKKYKALAKKDFTFAEFCDKMRPTGGSS